VLQAIIVNLIGRLESRKQDHMVFESRLEAILHKQSFLIERKQAAFGGGFN